MTTIYITALDDGTHRIFRYMTLAILYGITTGQQYRVLVSTDALNAPFGCLLDDPGDPDGPRLGALWASRGLDLSSQVD